jgi:hypothetical protein
VAASASADIQIKSAGESGTTDDALRQAEENLNYTRQINDAISSDDPEFAALMKQVEHEAADTHGKSNQSCGYVPYRETEWLIIFFSPHAKKAVNAAAGRP